MGTMRDSTDSPQRDQGSAAVRFLVDSTAGRLARWLRLMGYDAAYSGAAADYRLVHRARAEGRVLLTRRKSATELPWAEALLLTSDLLDHQLEQVARSYPPPEPPLTRCSICNTPLEKASKKSVKRKVPPYVYDTVGSFSVCPGCGHVYWPGTHYARILARWMELRDLSRSR